MNLRSRFALVGAVALLVVLAGTTLATRAPVNDRPAPAQADETEEAPGEAAVQHAVERLGARGIDVDPEELRALAREHGIGGAVRILAWSAQGADVDEILRQRADGRGWGVIARELGLHPGLGSVMGNGGGHGRENAPGQQRDRGTDD